MAIGGAAPDPRRRDKLDALLSGHMARVDAAPLGSVTVTDLRPALADPRSVWCMIEIGTAEIEHYGTVVGLDWARQVARAFIAAGYTRVRVSNMKTSTVIDDLQTSDGQ